MCLAGSSEDDEFARCLESMRQRWPAIARAADHPLTEWLFNRHSPRKSVFETLFLFLFLFVLPSCCVFPMPSPAFYLCGVVIALLFIAVATTARGRASGLRFISPPDWRKIALVLGGAPLNYGELASCEALQAFRCTRSVTRWFALLAWTVAGVGVGLFLAKSNALASWTVDHLFFVSGLAVLWFSVTLLYHDLVLQIACRGFYARLKAACMVPLFEFALGFLFLGIIGICGLGCWTWFAWFRTSLCGGVLSFVGAFAAIWLARGCLSRSTERMFHRQAKRGQLYYEWLVRAHAEQK